MSTRNFYQVTKPQRQVHNMDLESKTDISVMVMSPREPLLVSHCEGRERRKAALIQLQDHTHTFTHVQVPMVEEPYLLL
jgi:hypothetical protein